MRRIGVLLPSTAGDAEYQARMAAFLQGLGQLGWTIGRNVRIDTRWYAGDANLIRKYVAELIALAPDVILAPGTTTMGPLLQATRTVPIVFTTFLDPVDDEREHNWHSAGRLQQRPQGRGARGEDDVGRKRGQLRRVPANLCGIGRGPAGVDAHVAADGPARLLQALMKCRDAKLKFRIVRGGRQEHADAAYAFALLRARRERQTCCCQSTDKFPTPHASPKAQVRSAFEGYVPTTTKETMRSTRVTRGRAPKNRRCRCSTIMG